MKLYLYIIILLLSYPYTVSANSYPEYKQVADEFNEKGNLQSALAQYHKALPLAHTRVQKIVVLSSLAVVSKNLGKIEKSRSYIQQVLKLSPKQKWASKYLSNLPPKNAHLQKRNGIRFALVIGNSNYHSQNKNKRSITDAANMSAKLKELGFTVKTLFDADLKKMKSAITLFTKRLTKTNSVGLFYFSGTGIQSDSENYLLPVNSTISSDADIQYEAVNVNRIIDNMRHVNKGMNLVILDASRKNPLFKKSRDSHGGLAKVNSPKGALVMLSTTPGDTTNDENTRMSIFTQQFIKTLNVPSLSVEEVFKKTAQRVYALTQSKQLPWIEGILLGEFVFNTNESVAVQRPNILNPGQPKQNVKTWIEKHTGIEFVYVPEGCYQMGTDYSVKVERVGNEWSEKHCFEKGFWLSKFEVTNKQFRLMKPNHNSGSLNKVTLNGENQPAVDIAWLDARQYAKWIGNKIGHIIRLPAQSEWEYAAKAGSNTLRYWGNNSGTACEYANVLDKTSKIIPDQSNVHDCSDQGEFTVNVGSYKPNQFGLYDMLGNASEWTCSTQTYSPKMDYRFDCFGQPPHGLHSVYGNFYPKLKFISMGGSWVSSPKFARSSAEVAFSANTSTHTLGFRLLMEAERQTNDIWNNELIENTKTYNPSFNCKNSIVRTENIICKNKNLSRQDRWLTSVYKDAKIFLTGSEYDELRDNQRIFIRKRNSCLNKVDCIKAVVKSRIDTLYAQIKNEGKKDSQGYFFDINGTWHAVNHVDVYNCGPASEPTSKEILDKASIEISINYPNVSIKTKNQGSDAGILISDDLSKIVKEECKAKLKYQSTIAKLYDASKDYYSCGSCGCNLMRFPYDGFITFIDLVHKKDESKACGSLVITGRKRQKVFYTHSLELSNKKQFHLPASGFIFKAKP
jgi:formylglycine-generating enzyme required for sulfatase activity/uncharacterized protein